MSKYVLLYKFVSNPRGLPGDWPAEVRTVGEIPFPEPWVLMTDDEFNAHIAGLADAYHAWELSQISEQAYIDAVQRHLDDTARSRNYDGILSLCSYGSSKHPKFGSEGKLAVDWRDAVWAYCYQALADVVGGHRPVPTVAEFISELPKMEW